MANYTIERNDFNNKLVALMTKIDEVAEKLGTGDYVEMANIAMAINELKQNHFAVAITPHYQRVVVSVENPRKKPATLLEKRDSKDHRFCKRCDNWVKKTYYKKHRENNICVRIGTSKLMTRKTERIETWFHEVGQIINPNFRKYKSKLNQIDFIITDEDTRQDRRIDTRRMFNNTSCNEYYDYVHQYRLPDPEI
jgi:hypothetical protein